MKHLLLRDKKGISIMIGYVLLVIIGITIAVLVYGFLKVYVPSNKAACPDNVALSIEEFSCINGAVRIQLNNRGLFSVDGAYIRIGEKGRVFKELLNKQNIYFDEWTNEQGLPPGESWPKDKTASFPYKGLGEQILEVEPVIFVGDELTLCNRAVISQPVVCIEGEFLLNVEIEEPAGDYSSNDPQIPIKMMLTGENMDKCWYNVTDSSGTVIEQTPLGECSGSYSGMFDNDFGTGDFTFYATLSNTSGFNATSSSEFSVTGGSSITFFITSPEQGGSYGYENFVYTLPINYQVTGADQCTAKIQDANGARIGNEFRNACTININSPPFHFNDNGIYTLNITALSPSGNENKYVGFNVLVYPEIDITSPTGTLPPNQCSPMLRYDFTVRRYPVTDCTFYLFNETRMTGSRIFSNCDPTSEPLGNLDAGRYTIVGYINDTDNPSNSGTDSSSFVISGGNCFGYGGGGSWAFPL